PGRARRVRREAARHPARARAGVRVGQARHRQRDHRPQGARADGAVLGLYHLMGGLEMAPQTPQRSRRPGEAVAPLDATSGMGGLEMAPQTPQRSRRPGEAVATLDGTGGLGEPERAPHHPPNARGAPGKPWRPLDVMWGLVVLDW